mgnify:CR=1 FL=1
MTLRRRSFLGLFGAAIAAPALPAAAPAVGYSRASYGLAMVHAQTYPLVSVRGLVNRLGLTQTQATAIINKMSADGVLGAIAPTRPGTVFASSKVYSGRAATIAATKLVPKAKAKPLQRPKLEDVKIPQPKVIRKLSYDFDLSKLMAHLHGLCGAVAA